jgi:hypothetical protein
VPGRHGPNTLRHYVATHDTIMEQFHREGFVESDTLEIASVGDGIFQMEGQIACLGGLLCTVEKWLETVDVSDLGNPRVQTFSYSYNVSVAGMGNLFRYDNADHHGHPDQHHRHAYDWRTGTQPVDSPRWIGAAGWPTLGDVLREMSDWYWEHEGELPRR